MEERLQKIMAHAGVASRRASEELIRAGRVTVNGQVVTQLGAKADPRRDRIAVDGALIPVGAGRIYIKLNKPVGVLSTADDPHGRRTVLDLVQAPGRVYPVGRLDYDSEGLILLTNDGEVTARLTHARHGHPKTYLTLVRGVPNDAALAQLVAGVELDDGPAQALEARRVIGEPDSAPGMRLPQPAGAAWLEITVMEGRNHLVRRLLDKIGHPVERLIRVRLGPLALGDLRPGEWRALTPAEVRALRGPHATRPARAKARGGPLSAVRTNRRAPVAPKSKREQKTR